MKHTTSSSKTAIRNCLGFALKKLTQSDAPFQLRATSYVRVCSNVMNAHYDQDHSASYLTLLTRLSQVNSQWWTTCFVNAYGLLESQDLNVQMILQTVNNFVQAQLELNPPELNQVAA